MKNKKNVKKTVATTALATGTMVLGALAGATDARAADLFAFETLGSGAELRSELLAVNDATDFIKNNELELKCGEGKAEEKKSAKAADGKAAEAKCGEGKCGEGKKEAKSAKAADGKAAEDKCGEGKCGEGKCGEKKVEKKAEKKAE